MSSMHALSFAWKYRGTDPVSMLVLIKLAGHVGMSSVIEMSTVTNLMEECAIDWPTLEGALVQLESDGQIAHHQRGVQILAPGIMEYDDHVVRRPGPPKRKRAWDRVLLADPCAYCGSTSQHIEHVHPRALGGKDNDENKVGACASCNQRKRAHPLLTFLLNEMERANV